MPAQCQVDFYVLQEPEQSAGRLACHLALKAWKQGKRVAVMTKDEAAAGLLDELMWNNPAGRFIPHAMASENIRAPVVIGTAESLGAQPGEVIINLTESAVAEPDQFTRLLEIVPAQEVERKASRLKFRCYRDLGLKPSSHPINKKD